MPPFYFSMAFPSFMARTPIMTLQNFLTCLYESHHRPNTKYVWNQYQISVTERTPPEVATR